MAYLHIPPVYKNPTILMFRRILALEKIHGSSASLTWKDGKIGFHPGGGSIVNFTRLFDIPELTSRFEDAGRTCTVYGEFYGGTKLVGQGMVATYGHQEKFIVFDVLVTGTDRTGEMKEMWLSVPAAAAFATRLGLDFVHYEEIDATVEAIDAARDADSVQAVRNGCGTGHAREGVVLRPLVEMTRNNGERVIAKHRRAEFVERASGEPAVDTERLAVLDDAIAVADEWVVPRRLQHVLDKLDPPATSIRDTGRVLAAMVEDVVREATGEIVDSKEVRAAIGRRAAELFHTYLRTAGERTV